MAHWLMTERLCTTPPGLGEAESSLQVKVGSHLGGGTTHLQELRSAGPCLWVLIQGRLQEISELCGPGRTDRWGQGAEGGKEPRLQSASQTRPPKDKGRLYKRAGGGDLRTPFWSLTEGMQNQRGGLPEATQRNTAMLGV